MHFLKKYNSLILSHDQKIYQAIDKINNLKIKILFVVDKKNIILESIYSGDIRRSISKKLDLNENIQKIMFKKTSYSLKKIKRAREDLFCMPIANNKKFIVDFQLSNTIKKDKKNSIF